MELACTFSFHEWEKANEDNGCCPKCGATFKKIGAAATEFTYPNWISTKEFCLEKAVKTD